MIRSCALLVLLALAACTERSLDGVSEEAASDLAASMARDLSVAMVDAASSFDGPKRHLGEKCAEDAECLSGTCLTAYNTRGQFDNVCGATCDKSTPCLEGICLSYDFDVYWCLPPCDARRPATECRPAGFVCCETGTVDVCVSPAAITCLPL